MSDVATVVCWPACTDAIQWSSDGIVALASDERVELLVSDMRNPTIKSFFSIITVIFTNASNSFRIPSLTIQIKTFRLGITYLCRRRGSQQMSFQRRTSRPDLLTPLAKNYHRVRQYA